MGTSAIMDEKALKEQITYMKEILNERQYRCYLGKTAISLGRGGLTKVARLSGASVNTVRKGIAEVKEPPSGIEKMQIRRTGGGRKSASKKYPNIEQAIEEIIDGKTYGAHPDRNAQFEYINRTAKEYLSEGEPVLSIDCKKKENLGNFKNNGHEYCHKKSPRKVLDHDFLIKELGSVAPYGVYDVDKNIGFVNLGLSHDTAEFAVNSIMQWWLHIGKETYPHAKRIYINCDGGGSNGSRLHLWKAQIAKFAEATGLEVHVSHFPPGTSKWNKIEHRLFCYISKTWAGQPLVDIETVIDLIGSTTTKQGLKVKCVLDTNDYPTGIKVSNDDFSRIDMERIGPFHDWNYIIRGFILHAENICSNSSGNWTAFGNCGKGVFPNWYKVMEKLDALAYKAVNILFVISICVADDGINFLLEGSKVTIVFCGQLPLDKFPKTFYQVEIWAVSRWMPSCPARSRTTWHFWYLALSSTRWTSFSPYAAAILRSMAHTSVAVM